MPICSTVWQSHLYNTGRYGLQQHGASGGVVAARRHGSWRHGGLWHGWRWHDWLCSHYFLLRTDVPVLHSTHEIPRARATRAAPPAGTGSWRWLFTIELMMSSCVRVVSALRSLLKLLTDAQPLHTGAAGVRRPLAAPVTAMREPPGLELARLPILILILSLVLNATGKPLVPVSQLNN